MNRRDFLASAAGAAAAALPFPRAIASASPQLVAAPTTIPLLSAAAPPVQVWGYNDTSPGPEIRVKAGERVKRQLVNRLPQPTAIHWHGIRIANAMDGAAGMTQEPVGLSQTFDYDFVAPDPGTYWYHSHDRSWEQAARGLHGPLIVEEPEPWKGADREIVLHLDDWYLMDGQIDAASFGQLSEWSHGGRMGNTFTANGRVNEGVPVRAGERLRLRLINAANARIMALRLRDHAMTIVAVDGHPVTPREAEDGYVVLAPAQRADLVVDMSADPGTRAPLELYVGDGMGGGGEPWQPLATFAYSKEKPLPRRTDAVLALPDTMRHDLDLEGARKVRLAMDGGAMGTMQQARLQGRVRSMRELVSMKRVWAFNGSAGDMDEPLFTVERGRTVDLTIQNNSRWPHAMHLHGHHFKVLARNRGRRPERARHQDWRDTVLSEPMESLRVAFDATNPGKWLLHCHMLEHQAGGMITWFEVT